MSRFYAPGRRSFWLSLLFLLLFTALILIWREQSVSSAADTALDVTFSAPPGRYARRLELQLSAPNPAAQIYYTLDGSPPDQQTATLYESPLILQSSEPQVVTLRAQAFLPGGVSGPIHSASYIMGLETGLPVLSIIADPADLWDEERGIYVNHEGRGLEWERPVDLTYVEEGSDHGFQSGAGLRIHGEWTRWYSDKKSLRLYFRELYGTRKLEYPLFGQQGQVAFDNLYLHNSDKDLLLFRNQLTERLFRQMGGYAVRGRPLLLFINGEPWGIYNIRERIDERFLQETYGVPAAAISDTPNIPSRQTAEQRATDLVHWENLMTFIEENDLTDDANYAYLQTQMDLANFVDYYLLEMYIANTDWPHHNMHVFRPETPGGRWEWIVWDNDLAFDRADRQMVEHVLTVDHPLGKRMEVMLNKLLENPDFYNLFLTRAADLLNTTLSAENVGAEVESSLAELAADIPLEKARWNVPEEWEDVSAAIRNFAATRADIMREHFVESFGLAGTARLSVAQDGGPAGWLVINDLPAAPLPWSGIHFIGPAIRLRAVPPAGYAFVGWQGYEGAGDPSQPLIELPVTGDASLTARFRPLDAAEIGPGDVVVSGYSADDAGAINGDWFELLVRKPGGVDLRGWRVTDNDTPMAQDEGSLVFRDDPLLAHLEEGVTVRVVATINEANDLAFPEDRRAGGVLTLYAGNGRIDSERDPWFNLGLRDNLMLLAPAGGSEEVVDLWSENGAVRREGFGLPPRE
ncbi:MAG: CotH kinase family protein [Candidatus Promineifilaceae bacterium]